MQARVFELRTVDTSEELNYTASSFSIYERLAVF
jgi:hypothetical protein